MPLDEDREEIEEGVAPPSGGGSARTGLEPALVISDRYEMTALLRDFTVHDAFKKGQLNVNIYLLLSIN